MSQQSLKRVFVSNTSTLLASGSTVDSLAVGQVGILDAKTYLASTAPTYAKNKALRLVWGTPDLGAQHLFSGVPNENEYTDLIKGKLITEFKGIKAKRGQQQIVTIGWSGDAADTNTISGKLGEVKRLYVKLMGAPIDKKFSLQGIIKQYASQVGYVDPCGTDTACTVADPRLIATDLVNQINADKDVNDFIKATLLASSYPAGTLDTDYKFKLTVCDTQDDKALGDVQAQYPADVVKRIGINGSLSIYEVVHDTNSAPAAFSNLAISLIPDCSTCPSGYTLVANTFGYKVVRVDAGSAGALTTLKTDYAITANETASRVQYENGISTYILGSNVAISAAVGTDDLAFLGNPASACILTTPTTIAWESNGTVVKKLKKFRITVGDTVCGVNRLTDLQAAYPTLTVALVPESSGTCVHTFETSVYSAPYVDGCGEESIVWAKPQAFEGVDWTPVDTVLGSSVGVLAGIRLEVINKTRVTSDVVFDYFPFEHEVVQIQASEFDPVYNNQPERIAPDAWAVKQIQGYQFPVGHGASVRVKEKDSKSYDLRERSFDPVVRNYEGYEFVARPDKYYDEYILTFAFEYNVGGWGEKYRNSHKLHVFFQEGQGGNFENAINSYLASANINVDPVKLTK
jgi:hypothetical protein